jgi:hypothetical protein
VVDGDEVAALHGTGPAPVYDPVLGEYSQAEGGLRGGDAPASDRWQTIGAKPDRLRSSPGMVERSVDRFGNAGASLPEWAVAVREVRSWSR